MQQYYTHLISPAQLSLLQTCTSDSVNENVNDLIIFDASIPPVGGAEKPSKCWPAFKIKNAKRFDLEKDFSDTQAKFPHTLPSIEQFCEQAQKLGVNTDSQIVIYDDLGIFSSARAWWMFKAMGHKNVAVLDGGLPLWLDQQYPHSNDKAEENIERLGSLGNFKAHFDKTAFCDHALVTQYLSSDHKRVLDARGENRFLGRVAEPRAGVRRGHMPGAINLPYSQLLSNGCLLPIEELKVIFSGLIKHDDAIITTCGSGVTACILLLAAQLAGYDNITVYDGSWSEWGQLTELPVITSET